jgi:hypothetical protein
MQYVELMVLSGREHNVMDFLKKKLKCWLRPMTHTRF